MKIQQWFKRKCLNKYNCEAKGPWQTQTAWRFCGWNISSQWDERLFYRYYNNTTEEMKVLYGTATVTSWTCSKCQFRWSKCHRSLLHSLIIGVWFKLRLEPQQKFPKKLVVTESHLHHFSLESSGKCVILSVSQPDSFSHSEGSTSTLLQLHFGLRRFCFVDFIPYLNLFFLFWDSL